MDRGYGSGSMDRLCVRMDQDLNHFEISSQIETIKLLKGFYKNHKLAISGLTTCNYNWESTLRLIGLYSPYEIDWVLSFWGVRKNNDHAIRIVVNDN